MAKTEEFVAPIAIDSSRAFDRSLLEQIPESLNISGLGEGLNLLNVSNVELTKDFAKQVLELEEFEADRKLNQFHVMRLKAAMDRGTFLPSLVQVITCECNGKTYRLNSQHVSWARLEMPANYRCPVRLFRYSAKTENDMRRLYASIDRGKARSKRDVVNSYLYGTDEWEGFKKSVIGWVSEGFGLWLWQSAYERAARDGDDRSYLLMTDYLKVGQTVAEFIQTHQSDTMKYFRRAPVVAALFATFDKSKAAATEFWNSVAEGTGFTSQHDPRNVLRTFLLNARCKVGAAKRSEQIRSVGQEEMFRCCIYAWNAWRQGNIVKQGLRANIKMDRTTVL